MQVQKLKLDTEAAMLELDQILRANELTVAVVAAIPLPGHRGGDRLPAGPLDHTLAARPKKRGVARQVADLAIDARSVSRQTSLSEASPACLLGVCSWEGSPCGDTFSIGVVTGRKQTSLVGLKQRICCAQDGTGGS